MSGFGCGYAGSPGSHCSSPSESFGGGPGGQPMCGSIKESECRRSMEEAAKTVYKEK